MRAETLVEVAARCLRMDVHGLRYAQRDIATIVATGKRCSDGEALYAALAQLLTFAAFLPRQRGKRAQQSIVVLAVPPLVQHLEALSGISIRGARLQGKVQRLITGNVTGMQAGVAAPTGGGFALR